MNNRLLRLARWISLLYMLFCIAVYIAGVISWLGYASNFSDKLFPFDWSVAEMTSLLSRVGLTFQAWFNIEFVTQFVTAVCYCIVGGFIFTRKKDDWFGLFVSLILVSFGTITSDQVFLLQDQYPWSSVVLQSLSVFTWALWFILFYLFPDGHFVPRWMRWFAAMLFTGLILNLGIYGGGSPPAWVFILVLPGIVMGLVSQVYRYRRVSGPVERQQTKWVFISILALIIGLTIGILASIFPEIVDINSPSALFFLFYPLITYLLALTLPLSIGFAILRYRLWDVDLIIQRTLVYGALTLSLALLYFGLVTLLQSLSASVFGRQSPIVIVLSTLVIAALVNPLRRRIQDLIDRRFFRRKYDAEKALAQFAEAARNETDIGCLNDALLEVVQETMQPERVSLWMRQWK